MNERFKLIRKLDKLIFQKLKAKYSRCQLCGSKENLGPFHILSKQTHPRLRFCEENILITCWQNCHYVWHSDYFKAKEIEQKIIELKGFDYLDRLKIIEMSTPKLTTDYLRELYEQL